MTETVKSYGWSNDEGPDSCEYIAPRILELVADMGVKKLLDIGSGNGSLCGLLAKKGYYAAGVEYDAGGVEISRKSHPNINFYCLGVQDDPRRVTAAEGMFDAVISTEVIEHLFSPHLLPEFARGVLISGGKLIITTPYHGYLKNLLISIFNGWDKHLTPLWHGGHIKFWSRRTIAELLSKGGFKIVYFGGVGRFPYLWKSMVVVAEKCE